jgi:CBS domain-containing protein
MHQTVSDILTANPACCSPDTNLQEVARLMLDHHCGEIPVLDADEKPLGAITDRDITLRAVAQGKNPLELTAQDCMTTPAVTINQDASIEQCIQLMEENLIRRVIVTDSEGRCCGIVAQADIAEKATEEETAEVLREVSAPTEVESRIH